MYWVYVLVYMLGPGDAAPPVITTVGPFETATQCEDFAEQQTHPEGYAAGCLKVTVSHKSDFDAVQGHGVNLERQGVRHRDGSLELNNEERAINEAG